MQVETHRELVTVRGDQLAVRRRERVLALEPASVGRDRKSTRLNSSHQIISYAVFCLEQKSTRLNSSHQIISYAVFCLEKKSTCTSYSHPIVSFAVECGSKGNGNVRSGYHCMKASHKDCVCRCP